MGTARLLFFQILHVILFSLFTRATVWCLAYWLSVLTSRPVGKLLTPFCQPYINLCHLVYQTVTYTFFLPSCSQHQHAPSPHPSPHSRKRNLLLSQRRLLAHSSVYRDAFSSFPPLSTLSTGTCRQLLARRSQISASYLLPPPPPFHLSPSPPHLMHPLVLNSHACC